MTFLATFVQHCTGVIAGTRNEKQWKSVRDEKEQMQSSLFTDECDYIKYKRTYAQTVKTKANLEEQYKSCLYLYPSCKQVENIQVTTKILKPSKI